MTPVFVKLPVPATARLEAQESLMLSRRIVPALLAPAETVKVASKAPPPRTQIVCPMLRLPMSLQAA